MLLLERQFLKNFQDHNKKEALGDLDQLINKFLADKQDDKTKLRLLRNYLIWLNGIIFEKTFLKPGCKKRVLIHKDSFLKDIESHTSIDQLRSISNHMVTAYFDSLETRCNIINPIVNNAIIYIDNNLNKDLSLENVAKILNISQSYLSSLFSETMKTSFSNFVNLRRIKKAKLLLETTDFSLIEVALECGFNSQSYFCYVFKKMEDITPTNFKKQSGKLAI